MSNITLPRAVIEQVREALKELDYASEPYVNEIARTALAALDAALAEPNAKREPATEEVIEAKFEKSFYVHPEALDDFAEGWCEAERFHGIRKENQK